MTANDSLFPAAAPPLAPMSLVIPTGLVGPMIKIQAELAASDLIKNRKADAGKVPGQKVYTYVDLPTVIEHILSVCIRNGVLVTQPPTMDTANEVAIATILAVASGEQLCAVMRYPRNGDVQALGSAVTYLRRYSLLTLFSLAPEEDDDDGKRAVDASRGRAAPASLPAQPAPTSAPSSTPAAEVTSGQLRDLFRKRLVEAWPAHAAVLGSDEGKPKVAAIASAFFGKAPKDLTAEEMKTWFGRLSTAPVERIIDKTGQAVAIQFPAAQLRTIPAATSADYTAALLKRIKEAPAKFEGLEQELADDAQRHELFVRCTRALFPDASTDWTTWSPSDISARTYEVIHGDVAGKFATVVALPF